MRTQILVARCRLEQQRTSTVYLLQCNFDPPYVKGLVGKITRDRRLSCRAAPGRSDGAGNVISTPHADGLPCSHQGPPVRHGGSP